MTTPHLSQEEANAIMPLIIGRLFLMLSRPEQPGDIEAFHAIRSAALDCGDALGIKPDWKLEHHK
jgi:hypothetical protein